MLAKIAISNGAEFIVFPELSLTGYEPSLANKLAVEKDDRRFDCFQALSDTKNVVIGVGAPTRDEMGVKISVVLFQPHRPRQLYSKGFLHPDEEPFFVAGSQVVAPIDTHEPVALAICYELSVPQHAVNAAKSGAKIYVASVAKSKSGVDQASKRLSDIAREYSMTVLMANSVGHSDGFESGGKSSARSPLGLLLGQLDETNEGLLIVNTASGDVTSQRVD